MRSYEGEENDQRLLARFLSLRRWRYVHLIRVLPLVVRQRPDPRGRPMSAHRIYKPRAAAAWARSSFLQGKVIVHTNEQSLRSS